MSYMESPDGSTRHVFFPHMKLPDGWRLVDGPIPGPVIKPDPSVRDLMDAILSAKDLADLQEKVKAAKGE